MLRDSVARLLRQIVSQHEIYKEKHRRVSFYSCEKTHTKLTLTLQTLSQVILDRNRGKRIKNTKGRSVYSVVRM